MSNDFNYSINQGYSHLVKKEYKKAIKEIRKALNVDPKQHMAWLLLTTAYAEQGKFDKALEASESIIKFDTEIKEKEDIFKRFLSNLKDQNLIESMERAFDEGYEFKGQWEMVASYYAVKGELDTAVKAYEKALAIQPKNIIFWYLLTALHFKREDFEACKLTAQKSLELKSDFMGGLVFLGFAYAELKELKKAEEIYEKVIVLDPLYEKVVGLRKKIYEKKTGKDLDLSVEKYQGINLFPDQKQFLVDIEKAVGEIVPSLVHIELDDYRGNFGFVSRAGYITQFGLDMKLLKELPESIGNLKYLRKLSISHCVNLRKIPESFENLQNLTKLKYEYNPFDELVAVGIDNDHSQKRFLYPILCKIKKLKYLDVRDSIALTALPDCLGELASLEVINITNCHNLSHIPESIKKNFRATGTGHQEILRRLDTIEEVVEKEKEKLPQDQYNRMKLDPSEVTFLRELEDITMQPLSLKEKLEYHTNGLKIINNHITELTIGNFKQLIDLPRSIGNLQYLERLNLVGNQRLESLPDSIGSLKSLKILHILSCMALKGLPESIGNLLTLEDLLIQACNKTSSLPRSIGNLKSLKQLHLRHLTLKSLPESVGNLKNVEEILLEGYQPIKLPQTMKHMDSLKRLTIKVDIKEDTLPEGITHLKSLEKLIITSQTNLMSLGDIEKLTTLTHLSINTSNAIKQFPINFGNLRALKVLRFMHNTGLEKLPESLCKIISLEELHLNACFQLVKFPDNISDLKNLKKLALINCRALKELPKGIENLPAIEEIVINYCPLTEVPIRLARIKTLKSLLLTGAFMDSDDLYTRINAGTYNEEEAIDTLKLLIGGSPRDRQHQIFEILKKLVGIHLESTRFPELYHEICTYCVNHSLDRKEGDIDEKIRNFCLKIIIQHFAEKELELIKKLVERERSVLCLRTLVGYLKATPQLVYLKNRLFKRLSTHYYTTPEEAEVIFEYEARKLDSHYNMLLNDGYFSFFGTNSVPQLVKSKRTKYYSVENGHITGIILSWQGLSRIPESIRKLSQLKYLDLKGNRLEEVPEWISSFRELQTLDVSNNQISQIPDELFKIRDLQINNNPLKEIPPRILKKLEKKYKELGIFPDDALILCKLELLLNRELLKLEDDHSSLKSAHHYKLDEINHVIGLYIHGLDKLSLTEIPHIIFSLKFLRELDFSDHYTIHSVPNAINKLQNLVTLRLSDNRITNLPESLFTLKSLESLNLSGNAIETIPEQIKGLLNVIHLDLSNNECKSLPVEIGKLDKLRFLGLDNNQLEQLPESIENFSLLRELFLSFNRFHKVPPMVCQLKSLERVSLSGNIISQIPSQIKNLGNLKELFLMGNKIKELPDDFSMLPKLSRLDLSDNLLEIVPESLEKIDSLNYLDLSYNKIKSHPRIENKIRNFIMFNKVQKDYSEFM